MSYKQQTANIFVYLYSKYNLYVCLCIYKNAYIYIFTYMQLYNVYKYIHRKYLVCNQQININQSILQPYPILRSFYEAYFLLIFIREW